MMIDLFYPYVPKETVEEVSDVLRSRWIGQGPKVNEFEKEFSRVFNKKYCVAMSSGTAALETAYDLVGLKAGDEVITTPLTCTATNLTLLRLGVKIVWADILKETLCIDPLDVLSKITSKTKAIVQVHLGGIKAEVQGTHLPVISDACQALGIFSGDITCNSFQAIKHITTGDGGMITLPEESLYKKAKLYRWFGIDRDKKIANNWQAYTCRRMTFDIELPGAKRQMTDIAATMGLVGLKHYHKVMNHRERIFNIYRKELKDVYGLSLVDSKDNAYWLATLLVERRDDFAKMLFEYDIDTNVVQVRNDIYNIFGGYRCDLPVMNEVEHKYLSIPVGMNVSEDDAYYICDTIRKGW
jgi:dTDP-4-amino-4,6-dideoxygalactose transaminase